MKSNLFPINNKYTVRYKGDIPKEILEYGFVVSKVDDEFIIALLDYINKVQIEQIDIAEKNIDRLSSEVGYYKLLYSGVQPSNKIKRKKIEFLNKMKDLGEYEKGYIDGLNFCLTGKKIEY